MPLKTLVKVGRITNLSDARYCAGMGVDLLGFQAADGHPDYIRPSLFQEIRGWVSGPKIVAEVYGLNDFSVLPEIIRDYAPDFIELDLSQYNALGEKPDVQLIVNLGAAAVPVNRDPKVRYWILDQDSAADKAGRQVLVQLRNTNVDAVLADTSIAGISLSGSNEIRPGFKDYTGLAEILERLDE